MVPQTLMLYPLTTNTKQSNLTVHLTTMEQNHLLHHKEFPTPHL